ncbi:hypothetical protein DRV85_07795 [Rhodosalinus halophilus]|uniref:Uncharacterized protein n=1 Tax=Rhodosalinus halophilus TaxID=2259333 RepID=A0A365U9E4_9RHOB|nr:hypothetical protein [Rhodosalinus halophilus]RBI85625.1 hypothetical protein DRV85_07795 [Rhodosalinus halophilus]
MPDPFQVVSAAGEEMIGQIIEALEDRDDDPAMAEIVERYFAELDWSDGGMLRELSPPVSCGRIVKPAARNGKGVLRHPL